MNGIGLCGTVSRFQTFLKHAETVLNPGGQLIFDSCDIAYMYEELELPKQYYGEVQCRYEYAGELTEWFHWLYLDADLMSKIARENGWTAKIVFEDDHDQYLAVLRKNP